MLTTGTSLQANSEDLQMPAAGVNLSPTDIKKIDKAVAARTYLKTLALLNDKWRGERDNDPNFKPYNDHQSGLNYEDRRKLSQKLFHETLKEAAAIGLSKEHHSYWCIQTIDIAFAASNVILTIASSRSDNETLRQVLKDRFLYQDHPTNRLLIRLIQKDPFLGFAANQVLFMLNHPESYLSEAHKKQGWCSKGWVTNLYHTCGIVLDEVAELRAGIMERFKKHDKEARLLLMPLADEFERITTEIVAFACATGGHHERYHNSFPSLYYWPLYPNSCVSRCDLLSAVNKVSFPYMREILPDLEKGNITSKETAIPTLIAISEVYWMAESLQEIAKNLSKAIKTGKLNPQISAPQIIDQSVSCFSREAPEPGKQARISFTIKALQNEEFTVRIDRENDGAYSIDFGSTDLQAGIRYALKAAAAIPGTEYKLSDHVDSEGDLIFEQGKMKILDVIKEAHDCVSANERLAIIGAALSNLGFMISVREDSVVSHHRRENDKKIFSEKDFKSAVQAFRRAMK